MLSAKAFVRATGRALVGKSIAAGLALSLVAGAASAASYTLVYAGPSIWRDINNANVAVGSTFYDSYFGVPQVLTATVWKDGIATDFSASFGSGYAQAMATGINDLGVITGFTGGSQPGGPVLPSGAFNYSGSGLLQEADFLGAVQPGEFAQPAAINNHNVVVGASGVTAVAFATAPDGEITPLSGLGTLGGPRSSANAINDAGLVVGQADTSVYMSGQPLNRAFAYDGAMHDLGTLSSYENANSAAMGVNQSGAIVGFSDADFGRRAFLHTGTGPLQASDDLGTLGGSQSYGFGINDLGHVVGSSSYDLTGRQHAFLYRDGAMIDLNSLVDLPAEFAGWELLSADGINNNGWIIGTMTFGGNMTFGFVLAPTAAVPEPATWAFMLLGFGCMGAGLRRREGSRRAVLTRMPAVQR
ncbi:PEPxxWA-CTERM sorting domain-containing protein [Phenylobacterium sp.]|uniref:PEPxxWA-CTERM sorting domain-containing protein n=1 Tax=Phenylobacterium sp. TaxID=1871053 RepID=UPI0025FD747C|nr:PEPxxWA-CTERM sorting domain-containing protein [Phenylobacterium sp.]MBX3486213.1 DUF3466 family protein [Phenylobacterium sp.]MCW5760149.1 DUF3466 family protein [Phenylobacterium sp.]